MSEALAASVGSAPVGRAWTPPRVSGPLITFRGRNPDASELEREANAAIEAGYRRGYSEGLEAAATEVNQRLQHLDTCVASLTALSQQLARPLERLDESAAAELARLALAVGAQLARRELATNPGQVIQIIRDCLADLPSSQREVRVHVHPVDGAAVRERLDPMRNEQAWTLIDDHSVGRGGARVLVEASQVDARFDNRVATVVQSVLEGTRDPISGDVTAQIEAEGGSL